MKKNIIVALSIVVLLGFTVYNASNAQTSKSTEEEKTVAWYVAHIPNARQQNQQCHDNPDIKNSPNCLNALHALQISFNGGN